MLLRSLKHTRSATKAGSFSFLLTLRLMHPEMLQKLVPQVAECRRKCVNGQRVRKSLQIPESRIRLKIRRGSSPPLPLMSKKSVWLSNPAAILRPHRFNIIVAIYILHYARKYICMCTLYVFVFFLRCLLYFVRVFIINIWDLFLTVNLIQLTEFHV